MLHFIDCVVVDVVVRCYGYTYTPLNQPPSALLCSLALSRLCSFYEVVVYDASPSISPPSKDLDLEQRFVSSSSRLRAREMDPQTLERD